MTNAGWLALVSLLSALCVGAACSPETQDKAKDVQEKIEDKTEKIAEKTAEKSKEIAGDIAEKGKEVLSTTGEVITDGWITAKVSAKLSDEKLLKDSNVDVDTNDRIVTLKGAVASPAAKQRAVAIASGTEGVTRVDDQLAVKGKY
jgi:osmotically-inducible protein OsmY